jgi:ribosomal protein S18 acetylase RimI-like enzyme
VEKQHTFYDQAYYSKHSPASCMKLARKYHKSFFRKKGYFILVAERAGKGVGMIACRIGERPRIYRIRKLGSVDDIAVEKSHQGRGIATLLLRAAEIEFKKQKVKILTLRVDMENLAARNLYAGSGFKIRSCQATKYL